ncbi:alpha/beta fold hydrolase [Luedemannella helvata]|uniref:AB hydrolase-1 domain-containing protein n=1 Tax=Luedemannella helvata TaxID=349315 RepID=A0ABP4VZ61_9ACTN
MLSSRRSRVPVAVAALALLLVAGCSETGQPAAAKPSPVLDHCAVDVSAARQVTFANGAGGQLRGTVFGAGGTGIVLANQANSSRCAWEDKHGIFTGKQYRVLAFDFAGHGESSDAEQLSGADDVAAAAALLRAEGVTTIVLIGASKGAGAVLAAAATITPPVGAVVALSSGGESDGRDLTKVVNKLTMPVLYLASDYDSGAAENVKVLGPLTTSPGTEHHVLTSVTGHGIPMLVEDEVKTLVTDFLAKHAPAA